MTSCDLHGNASSSPDINLFVLATGRLPHLGDEVPPWHYHGWLLSQVQLADDHPSSPGRWNHHLRTLEAGGLLDEPIPQMRFHECPKPDGRKMLEKCIHLIAQRASAWTAFQNLIEWLAWGLAVAGEMPRLDEATNEALYRSFNFEPLLVEPHDYLGSMLSERRSGGWNPHAFFPTPHNVAEFMAQMTFTDARGVSDRDPRTMRVLDPAVGSGRLLLHASNYSYCLYGCDIDPLVAAICRVNAALYVPWLAFPLPDTILGVPVPPPPPARLPVPEKHQPKDDVPMLRCDDRGQGLFSFE
jgi:N-6 DNA methylase